MLCKFSELIFADGGVTHVEQRLKIIFLVMIDFFIIMGASFFSLFIRLEGNLDSYHYFHLWNSLPGIIMIRLALFYGFGLYGMLWRYAGMREIIRIISAVTVSTLLILVYVQFMEANLPKSTHFINWFLTLFLVLVSRFCVRLFHYWRKWRIKQRESRKRVLIIGAGDAGAMIAREIEQRYYKSKQIVGFLDDSDYKQGQQLFGSKVLGATADVKEIVELKAVDEIIIAMPSVSGQIVREIVNECKSAASCQVKTLPGIYELIDGKVSMQQLRDVDVEDLLRREPIRLNIEGIAAYLEGKRVLITGAGGSIGSELSRQVAKMKPAELVVLGKGENSIYEIDRQLRELYSEFKVIPVIGDVRDEVRMATVFELYKPQVVFHAAAHKHVPLMEMYPYEAVKNNILGTKILVEAAKRVKIETFVMISTDKAVNPTSVMGATKRVAELIVQSANQDSCSRFVAVRFGNVLGSRGSVIPLFKKQIARGGPVTVTHPEMKRYFMTIPEAVQLVLQAGSIATGGEVMVLDMGEPVKIIDLAKDLILLSGFVPDEDIEIKFTGLRSGEKLFEELLNAEDGTEATTHEDIFSARIKKVDSAWLNESVGDLLKEKDAESIVCKLQQLVPNYNPNRENINENKDVLIDGIKVMGGPRRNG